MLMHGPYNLLEQERQNPRLVTVTHSANIDWVLAAREGQFVLVHTFRTLCAVHPSAL